MTFRPIEEVMRLQSGRQSGRGRTALLALTGAVLVAICLVFTFVMAGWYRDVGRGLGASGESVAAAVAEEVDRNIELLDLALRALSQQWSKPDLQAMPTALRDRVLFDNAMRAPGFGNLLVLDRDGALVAHPPGTDPVSSRFGDRDYFRVHLAGGSVGLFVSKPFQSRLSGRWTLALSRRIDGPGGEFGGIVLGTLDLGYLAKLYKPLAIGPGSAVTLFRTDGTVITREPFVQADIRLWAGGGDAFNRMRSTHSGTFAGASPIDGEERIISYHRVGNLPLIQAVEITGEAAYADWWRRAVAVAGLLTLLCLGSMGLSLRLYREVGRRAIAEAELSRLAGTDALTGLANRRQFEAVLGRVWPRAAASGESLALLMIDADAFKAYNDLFGHQAGDGVLRAIAGRLDRVARDLGGLACRCGGEEFILLVPSVTEAGALATAEAARAGVEALALPHPRGVASVVTISVGVSVQRPAAGGTAEGALAEADAALYRAKAEGRNRCRGAPALDRAA